MHFLVSMYVLTLSVGIVSYYMKRQEHLQCCRYSLNTVQMKSFANMMIMFFAMGAINCSYSLQKSYD